MGERPYEYFDSVHTAITYEMNLNRIKIQRNVFSTFELLGDIGGVQSILLTLVGFIMSAYHYQRFELYMTSKLYRK